MFEKPSLIKRRRKNLKLQTISGRTNKTTTIRKEVARLPEVATKGEANVAVLNGLQGVVLAVKEAVAELFPAAKKLLIYKWTPRRRFAR